MQALPHPHIPLQASEGSVLRARAMQAYLLDLRAVLTRYAEVPPVHLMVLDESDWKARVKHPYGFPFQRTSLREGLYLFLPARYPERLLWRLRETLVPAIKRAGKPPGQPSDFLDLNLGHEYAHAVAVAWKLRTRVRWVDEFLANYLYLLALQQALPELYPQAKQWGLLLAHLTPSQPSLGSYETRPKSLSDQLWFQGQFTLEATRLVEEKKDMLLKGLLQAAPLKKSTVHKLLVGLEPHLRNWFASFSPQRKPSSATTPQGLRWEELEGS
ncbi:hypothetical protein [Meiothermus hypogaeus]|uniref:Uncharacterized protein n=2 Tax=Meiothermus hypogaeus TaxID=884155 RepID=A0A511R0T8_9DEIN|nr:hypothetical protein [Meiothermus hypogaeus]RIH78732.1 hypothetical protein Mhypo_01425 [Meiothermus hypogaeus]GEM83239.1 hypothetical protein MHY01S_14050 [Meiothermus hypogaeus NBRC 106114]